MLGLWQTIMLNLGVKVVHAHIPKQIAEAAQFHKCCPRLSRSFGFSLQNEIPQQEMGLITCRRHVFFWIGSYVLDLHNSKSHLSLWWGWGGGGGLHNTVVQYHGQSWHGFCLFCFSSSFGSQTAILQLEHENSPTPILNDAPLSLHLKTLKITRDRHSHLHFN